MKLVLSVSFTLSALAFEGDQIKAIARHEMGSWREHEVNRLIASFALIRGSSCIGKEKSLKPSASFLS